MCDCCGKHDKPLKIQVFEPSSEKKDPVMPADHHYPDHEHPSIGEKSASE